MQPIIHVEGLGKKYTLRHERGGAGGYRRLSEDLLGAVKRPFFVRKSHFAGAAREDFWALRDVSFDVQPGEVLGIIGRNGAGKSTLLKVLSRITEPTEGRVRIKGRIASLLEVGTGFHPELTGRENIYLNGAILGMSRAEIRRKFDEIVSFAEVEKFLDTPVKKYSSGMYVRLAFAVAAHLEPEILVVDEVLAVGDAEFQRKCLGKMSEVARHGRTVLFVSHNMSAIGRLCGRTILLHHGHKDAEGSPSVVTERYLLNGQSGETTFIPQSPQVRTEPSDTITLVKAELVIGREHCAAFVSVPDELCLNLTYHVKRPNGQLRVGFRLHSADGTVIFTSCNTDAVTEDSSRLYNQPGTYVSQCRIPRQFLNFGRYLITVASDIRNRQVNFIFEHALSFVVEPGLEEAARLATDGRIGLICPVLDWKTTCEN